ncbi:MAG: 2-dehydropantoate 2-reductase N-terminal domain-containing protein, partial [Pseudomonadota bacterium]|nr:2-dehydropantoate 2-reductase N-terminal domain-containing protein [Pseudomonadota bacterium]
MSRPAQRFAVLGAGSWGTALAMLLADNGHSVTLWTHRPEQADTLNRDRANQRYLHGLGFPKGLSASGDLESTLDEAEVILLVVPSHAFRETLTRIKPLLRDDHKLCWATKGLEPDSQKLLHQQAEEELGTEIPMAVIS